jgi:hypothetical protein
MHIAGHCAVLINAVLRVELHKDSGTCKVDYACQRPCKHVRVQCFHHLLQNPNTYSIIFAESFHGAHAAFAPKWQVTTHLGSMPPVGCVRVRLVLGLPYRQLRLTWENIFDSKRHPPQSLPLPHVRPVNRKLQLRTTHPHAAAARDGLQASDI